MTDVQEAAIAQIRVAVAALRYQHGVQTSPKNYEWQFGQIAGCLTTIEDEINEIEGRLKQLSLMED